MPHLFDPFRLREVQFAHRIFISPMCEYSCVDGVANQWHFVHLGSRAVGRAALVITEATAVTADSRISPQDLGLWNDAQVEALRPIFAFIEQQGSVPGMQLAHAGRKASTDAPWKGGHPLSPAEGGWTPIYAPSAIPFAPGYQTPVAMTKEHIDSVVDAFAAATRRALAAGAKLLEIHSAHGYLLHSFLSPLSNHRQNEDEYGGSFENRTRLLCQVVSAVRSVWPAAYPLSVRISSTDWVNGGWTIDDSVSLARVLKRMGVDVIDCSSGGVVPGVKIPVGPGYQAAFAERIRRDAGIPTIAVGMITEPVQADHIIRTGQADAVMLAREFLRQPYWPLHAAQVLGYDLKWPMQYERARLK